MEKDEYTEAIIIGVEQGELDSFLNFEDGIENYQLVDEDILDETDELGQEENNDDESVDEGEPDGVDLAIEAHNVEPLEGDDNETVNENEDEEGDNNKEEDSSAVGLEKLDKAERQVLLGTNPMFNLQGNLVSSNYNPTNTGQSSSINIASIVGARGWHPPMIHQQWEAINRLLVTKVILRKNAIIRRNNLVFAGRISKTNRKLRRIRRTNKDLDGANQKLETDNTKMALQLNSLGASSAADAATIEKGKIWVARLEEQVKQALKEKRELKEENVGLKAENETFRAEVGRSCAMALALDDPETILQGGSKSNKEVQFTMSATGYMVFPYNINETEFIDNIQKVGMGQIGKKPDKFYIHEYEEGSQFGSKFVFGVFPGNDPMRKRSNCLLCSKNFFVNPNKPFFTPLVIGAKTAFASITVGRICKIHISGKDSKVSTLNIVRKLDRDFFKDL